MAWRRVSFLGFLAALALTAWCVDANPARAQGAKQPNNNFGDPLAGIQWEMGPCTSRLRSIGEVKVPAGFKFTGEAGVRQMMKLTGNLENAKDMGFICPVEYSVTERDNAKNWFLVFTWDDVGYVKDDDKDNLPKEADNILKGMRDAEPQANQQRKALGYAELNLVGWEQAPFYDNDTKNLTWATRVRSGNLDTINYNARILGRAGCVSVELIIQPEQVQKELPRYKEIIKGYSFLPGQKYAEFREGDKVAAYGLTALIAGGAVAAAAKSGLLGKLGKVIIYIIVGAVGAVGWVFKKIFGGGSSQPSTGA